MVGAGDILVGAGSACGNAIRLRTNHGATNRDERSGEFMTKQIEIQGQRVQLYSLDQGRTWSSSPQAIVAYGQRQTMLRLELQKRFERIGLRVNYKEGNGIKL